MQLLLPLALIIGLLILVMQSAGADDSRTLSAVKAIILATLAGCLAAAVASVVLRSFFGALLGLYVAWRTFFHFISPVSQAREKPEQPPTSHHHP